MFVKTIKRKRKQIIKRILRKIVNKNDKNMKKEKGKRIGNKRKEKIKIGELGNIIIKKQEK